MYLSKTLLSSEKFSTNISKFLQLNSKKKKICLNPYRQFLQFTYMKTNTNITVYIKYPYIHHYPNLTSPGSIFFYFFTLLSYIKLLADIYRKH